jgi:hypothetical protein
VGGSAQFCKKAVTLVVTPDPFREPILNAPQAQGEFRAHPPLGDRHRIGGTRHHLVQRPTYFRSNLHHGCGIDLGSEHRSLA